MEGQRTVKLMLFFDRQNLGSNFIACETVLTFLFSNYMFNNLSKLDNLTYMEL